MNAGKQNAGQRKKRDKSKKRSKQKKRKSQTTRAYRETEAEVQRLLQQRCSSSATFLVHNSSSSAGDGVSRRTMDFDVEAEQSMDSFNEDSQATFDVIKHKQIACNNDGDSVEEEEDELDCAKSKSYTRHWYDYSEYEDEQAVDAEETTTRDDISSRQWERATATTSSTQRNSSGTTFLEIELDEPVTLPGLQKRRHIFDDDHLLYKPTSKPNLQLQLTTDKDVKDLRPTTVRMLNRIFEEAKANGEKVNETLIETLTTDNGGYLKDNKLYRTVCDYEFQTIFVTPEREIKQLPMRKFVKLHFGNLCFTAHQQLLDEHRLAHELTEMYELYTDKTQQRTNAKILAELDTARKVVQQLAARNLECSPQTAKQRTRDVDYHLEQVQKLRNSYLEAAAEQKDLLKRILDKWAALKLLRKQQNYQCTRFQLRLHIEQPEDIAEAYDERQRRFNQDFSEIYRERLEHYYTAKRRWQQRGGSSHAAKPPRKPSINKIREALTRQYEQSFYEPEEPRVHIKRMTIDEQLELVYNNLPASFNKLRTYFLKIYFDRQFVGQTRSYRLEPDLHLYMNETVGVLLERRLPQHVRLVLFEKTKLTTHVKLATIEMPLNVSPTNCKMNFIGAQCAGELNITIDLNDDEHRRESIGDIRRAITHEGLFEDTTSRQSLNEATPVGSARSDDSHNGDIFEESLLQFCAMSDILNNKRFRLLRSRYEGNDPRTKDLRLIPSLEHEIAYDWESEMEAVIEPGNWMDPIDLHKHKGKKNIKQIYETTSTHCARMAKLTENKEHLLVGEETASWASIFRALANVFSRPRPLEAGGSATAHMLTNQTLTLTPENTQTFNIVLNVVRASGIPVRSRHILGLHSTARSSDASARLVIAETLVYSNVRPFIVLSYRDQLQRTSTAEGSNPTWNEQLVLTVKANLAELHDDLKITLYDEIIEQQYNSNEDLSTGRSMDIYQRVQTNWLGEYRVPICSLIACQKYEGCFELNIPKLLVGYRRPTIDSVTNMTVENYPEIKEAVHLWCYLNLEPAMELPRSQTRCLDCAELKEVRIYLQQWCMEMRQLQPARYVAPLVCTASGQRVCITRLLEPVPLPIEPCDEREQTLDILCRFVSLLCVLKHYDACMGFQGVWLDNKTLLDNTWCSSKDLGVLLCNYFLTLGVKCWLVLGLAAPYGECTFVLYRHTDSADLMLVAPHSGKRYNTKDVHCPLSRIYAIVAQDNFYCNIQSENRVCMTNFNLLDGACWLPAFNKRNPAPLGGIQKLDYVYQQSDNLHELRKNIERKVMKKISAWRPMRKTLWNRAFQPFLMSILQELEHLATHAGSNVAYDEPKYSEELEREFPGYRFFGYTLNFAYTNLASISERIRSAGLHLNNDRYVEFAVAVHIHPYPNNVLSVWLFLLTIIPW